MTRILFALLLSAIVFSNGVQAATISVGPDGPYRQASDSPWDGLSFDYFYLEDHEDGLLNTPGVTVNTGFVFGPTGTADSVDNDDGVLNFACGTCRSYAASGGAVDGVVLTYTFDGAQLGDVLPDHVGIVVTNAFEATVTVEGFDVDSLSQGTFALNVPETSLSDSIKQPVFIGLQGDIGLSSVSFTFDFVGSASTIEIDHLQYGSGASVVPVPAAVWLFGSALGLLGWMRRKAT